MYGFIKIAWIKIILSEATDANAQRKTLICPTLPTKFGTILAQ